MNGMSGVVTNVDLKKQSLRVDYGDGDVEYTKEMFKEHPQCLVLGYCSTIHRAQGDG